MTSPLRIIVSGIIAQHPGMGGVPWDYGQYPLGLRLMGHDVYYFEDSGEWPYREDGGPTGDDYVARDCDANVTHLSAVMSRLGLSDRWAYKWALSGEWYGMPDAKRREIVRTADLVINVSGTLEHPDQYGGKARLVYIDSDPVFTQVRTLVGAAQITEWSEADGPDARLARRVNAHDVHFSFGELIRSTGPDTGHDWKPTRQPVVLTEWRQGVPPATTFTTVMNWTSYEPVVYGDMTYGQKDREFERFLQVARQVRPEVLEVAMGKTQHAEWEARVDARSGSHRAFDQGATDVQATTPHDLLTLFGWRAVHSSEVCGDFESYRTYIESSKGEWSVAKNGYVSRRPGWFSCRSACYLAAGRPVVTQDTGFTAILPAGEGLLAFSEPDQAVEAVRAVSASYARHSRQALSIAREFFDSGDVLTRLIDDSFAGAG